MGAVAPRLAFQVENKLTDEEGKLNIELNFKTFDDFDPALMLKQVAPLRKLFDARQRLTDLLTKLDGNDDLDRLLQDVVENTDELQEIKDSTSAEEEEVKEEESVEA